MSLVKGKREELGITLTELARRANIGLSKLSKIENDQLKLKVDDVSKLARALGCDPRDLIPVFEAHALTQAVPHG